MALPTNISEATRRLNPHLFGSAAPIVPTSHAPENAHKRLRQSTKPLLNKLETRFRDEKLVGGRLFYAQAVRIELALGHWYKPDFFLPPAESLPAIAFEVKGPHAFRGGFENLKTAARIHPWITFFLVWLGDDGSWQQQEILK